VKNRGGVLIDTLNRTSPLFFTGRKLRPPGIGIEATEYYYYKTTKQRPQLLNNN